MTKENVAYQLLIHDINYLLIACRWVINELIH